MTSNRRQFARTRFQTQALLFVPDGQFTVEVLDLSLKGALIRPEVRAFANVGTPCTLKIRLDEMGAMIRMESTIVHRQGNLYGLVCREIDLDSITHLRRLVALNLGDERLLDREFGLMLNR